MGDDARIRSYLPPLGESARRWLRFLGLVGAVVLLVWLCRVLSGPLTLLAVSFAAAYICNPLVRLLERWGVRRLLAVSALYALATALLLIGGLYFLLLTASQIDTLIINLPNYADQFRGQVTRWAVVAPSATPPRALLTSATQPSSTQPSSTQPSSTQPSAALPGRSAAPDLVRVLTNVIQGRMPEGWVATTEIGQWVSTVSWWVTTVLLLPVFTFFFLWKYDRMLEVIRAHLPAEYRGTIVHIAALIDEKTAAFFRGRVVTSLFVGMLMSLGWAAVGVPYALAFGMASGVLNLVPFLPLLSLPPALILIYLVNPGAWVWPALLAVLVYILVQTLEAFVLYPYLSAKTSGLHPVTVMVALLMGAEVAGVLGMLLSIPVASTLKALGAEYVLPELRRLASGAPAPPTAPPPATHAPPAAEGPAHDAAK